MNGQKIFITGVEVADYMLVVARTTTREEIDAKGMPKAFGLSLFLVDPKTKGITKTPIPTVATEGVYQWQLFFEDVEIPAENLVGVEDQGAMAMFNSLNPERILVGAICCGMAEQAIGMAVAYAKERKVFRDTPIGAYQGVAHPLAEAKIELEAAKLMTYRAAWAFDQGMEPQVVGSIQQHGETARRRRRAEGRGRVAGDARRHRLRGRDGAGAAVERRAGAKNGAAQPGDDPQLRRGARTGFAAELLAMYEAQIRGKTGPRGFSDEFCVWPPEKHGSERDGGSLAGCGSICR